MTKTENYQLNQWEPTDEVRREDFNSDNAAIDAAIQAVADTAAGKASAESVAALTAALGTGGQTCRIAYGTYTGTDTYGENNKNSLTFDFTPLMVVVYPPATSYAPAILVADGAMAQVKNDYCTVSWSDKSVFWYSKVDASYQLNYSGSTYHYIAIGY